MKSMIKTLLFWAVVLFAVSVFCLWQNDRHTPLISQSRFVSLVAGGQVSSASIIGGVVYVFDTRNRIFRVIAPPNRQALIADLQQHGVKVWIGDAPEGGLQTWLLKLESKLRFGS